MPRTLRIPVLCWQDGQFGWTARLVDGEAPAGFGRTAREAVDQIEDYLQWRAKDNESQTPPELEADAVTTLSIPIRPEYRIGERRFPSETTFPLVVHAVKGKQQHGLLICSMPILGIRFFYYDENAFKQLATHYVQQAMEGFTPRDLARRLPPREVRLEQIVLRIRSEISKAEYRPAFPTLAGIAESLGDPGFRRQFGKPYEREEQVASLVARWRNDRPNLLLVGEPGSGKTTILVEAVRMLERTGEDVKRSERIFWQTSGNRIISGMRYLGQWEECCENLIRETQDVRGCLCIDNLLDLLRVGGREPGSSVAAFLMPYLQRGELCMIAEASPAELDACRRLLPGLAESFEIVAIPEMTREQSLRVLEHLSAYHQANTRIEPADGVVSRVHSLFRRFEPYGAFPAKAGRFLSDAFDEAKQRRRQHLDAEFVLERFMHRTGLPEFFLRDEWPLSRAEALQSFAGKIIGQPEACERAADLVTSFKAGLNDAKRPIGVLLFCGPTGVGKTEMARAISEYFFGHREEKDRMIRLDMSEYAGPASGERLLTASNGEPSELIRRIRNQPFALVLLEEVEKADSDVFDVLMGVFDEGRLTDRYGRTANFTSAIVVMTSNLGAGVGQSLGFVPSAAPPYADAAMRFFRPEFFNRMDAVVTFAALGEDSVRIITRKELEAIGRREGMTRRRLRWTWTEEAERHLARVGFDPEFGARPLQRAIESLVIKPLSRFLLETSTSDATLLLRLERGVPAIAADSPQRDAALPFEGEKRV